MRVLGIDPGPTTSGLVVYDTEARRVLVAASAATLDEVHHRLQVLEGEAPYGEGVVVIERVQSYGIPGNDLLRTSEVVGRLWQMAAALPREVTLLYRREVCAALDVTGGSKDALVRARMLEMHGGTRAAAVGTKAKPGPLYGVSGHAWQALGLVVAWTLRQ